MEQNKMFDDPGKVREELTPETTLKWSIPKPGVTTILSLGQ